VSRWLVDLHAIGRHWRSTELFVHHGHGIGLPAVDSEREALELAAREVERFGMSTVGVCVKIAELCPACAGLGKFAPTSRRRCSTCRGRGRVSEYGYPIVFGAAS
jgi:hypothetical protein